jgi:hypothetical protein
MSEAKTFMVEDAQLLFRNFSGKESQYNRAGDRNFSVVLDQDSAERMLADGWNVKFLAAREEGDVPTPYIMVSVGYKAKPPRVVMISSTGRTVLDEGEVEVLDWVEINKVDLIARAYTWDVNGRSGIKAYLQSLYITIREDELERKYSQSND